MRAETKVLFGNDYQSDIVDALRVAMPEHEVVDAPEAAVRSSLSDVNVIIPARTTIGAADLDAAPQVRLIQQFGAGLEMVDLDAARARALPVANAPAAASGLGKAVAEFALLHLIGAGRRYPALATSIAARTNRAPFGNSLFGARVCIAGLGGIGRELIGVRRTPDDGLAAELGLSDVFTPDRLTDAVRDCRFTVLAVPLTPETEGFIDAEVLAAMPDGSIIVNVSRGPVIQRAALEDALASGHVAAAGLDVFWDEPVDPDDPLFAYQVFATPHCASSCDLFLRGATEVVRSNVERLTQGLPLNQRVA